MTPIRALVIGAGPAAVAMHLPVLARLRDEGAISLQLVCDVHSERARTARRDFGFLDTSGDAGSCLSRNDIDAVYLFGSAQLHYEYGLAALHNGKHLFVEKPVAPSYSQLCEVTRAARARGVIAVGGLNRRFYRALATIRAHGGKSRWRYAEAVFHKPELGKRPLFGAHTWLTANGIHALDALIYMMDGLPQRITALAGSSVTAEPGCFSAIMQWTDGSQGVFLCNNTAGARREEYAFHAPGKTCTVTGTHLIIEENGAQSTTAIDSVGDGIGAEHDAFLHAIRDGAQPQHSLDSIAPSLFLAELIEAGFSGRVELPTERLRNVAPPPRLAAKTILVTNSTGLQTALARWLPRARLVNIEEVLRSEVDRSEITAAILGHGSAPLSAQVLDKLPRLAVVGVVALSLERYAPDLLLARNIQIFNASAAYAESVAEFAMALAILGRRRAFISHELMRAGGWGTQARVPGLTGALRRIAVKVRPLIRAAGLERSFLHVWKAAERLTHSQQARPDDARDLRGAVVGLIGWGANARAFATRLIAAQARVTVFSEHASASDIQSTGAVVASLGDVLAADIVSLHRGLTEKTRHCLGTPELARLRPGSVLINVARGALIDPAALLSRLKNGDVVACLDTFEQEPLDTSHALRKLPNVFLTSHIAGGSRDMHAAAAEEVVRKVASALEGAGPEAISAARLSTMT
jgi:phosphoglycerate dehydrogenase-like enzyme/predicted dehydrogenase